MTAPTTPQREQCRRCDEWGPKGWCYDNGLCQSCDLQEAAKAETRQQERDKFGRDRDE